MSARRRAADRVPEILEALDAHGEPRIELDHESALQLLVATILSAQCTDERVNQVTPHLFGKYPTAADYAAADPSAFEEEIRSTGFFRNKTKSILGMARVLVERHGGKVPGTMEELTALPGVARKTANVILGGWFGRAEGIVVDTHVHRVGNRLGLCDTKQPEKTEKALMEIVPRESWIRFGQQMVLHGRYVCLARRPKCGECALERVCPRKGVGRSA